MGIFGSKASKGKPKLVTKGKNQETINVRLLVLHKNAQQPQPGTNNFCEALNTYDPPGSSNVDHSDVKISEMPDDGQFPEPVKKEISTWISEWLKRNRIVLVCLLSDCDLESLKRGTDFENNNKIIVFCFRNPPVNFPGAICIDEDFYTATPGSIREKLKSSGLVATIRAGGH